MAAVLSFADVCQVVRRFCDQVTHLRLVYTLTMVRLSRQCQRPLNDLLPFTTALYHSHLAAFHYVVISPLVCRLVPSSLVPCSRPRITCTYIQLLSTRQRTLFQTCDSTSML